jgi:MFS family permease
MTNSFLARYSLIFKARNFRSFWLGFTISALGDAMTRVALTWYVYELTGSARALGLLTLAYTGPVLLGGFLAGYLLDRFDRRTVILLDSLARGIAVLLVPVFHLLGILELWHIYLVAAVYGSLMMVSLAGAPALVPSLIQREQLDTANALETLSFTLSGIIGPPLAGVLIGRIGAPNVVLLDALSYFTFAALLLRVSLKDEPQTRRKETGMQPVRYRQAARLLIENKVLLATTLMFMSFNLGFGALIVWLPIYLGELAWAGPELYGSLLGVFAAGEVISAALAGSLISSIALGTRISIAQALSGLSLAILLAGPTLWSLVTGLFLMGFFSAPLTIWAQTLRMQVIPEEMRGRTFALLRTLMQGTVPLGGAIAGWLLPLAGIFALILLSALLAGIPGLAGLRVREMRQAAVELEVQKLEA